MADAPLPATTADAAAFLSRRFGTAVAAVEPLEGGEWSRAFGFVEGGRDLVVRFSAFDEAFRKDEHAARFATPSLPIPAVLEIGDVEGGGSFAISERRHGTYLEDASAAELERLLPSVFAALDAMRTADLGSTTGFGGWRADGHARFATWREALLDVAVDRPDGWTAGWRPRLVASSVGIAPFERAFDALREVAVGLPDARHLVHSDLLHANVLVADDRLSAVLDWGSSLYGDFLLDLGWLEFWAPWYPEWHAVDLVGAWRSHVRSIGLDVPALPARLRACELWIGLDGMAYQAFSGHWSDLARTAARTMEIVLERGH